MENQHLSVVKRVNLPFDPKDPLIGYFCSANGAIEIDRLEIDSDGLRMLRDAGVKLTIPLVSQGELIGLISLGPRLSDQDYSIDDRRILNSLSSQTSPALRVAQLARLQESDARKHERIENELRVARIIQETLLPQRLPQLQDWRLAAHWQPARAVSGDFYDFIEFPEGKLGIVIGDVTDKGVPAALVMAMTRTILRSTAEEHMLPDYVLTIANNLLCRNMPRNMFITCLYGLLDPSDGKIVFANAGHNLPYKSNKLETVEYRATGMPLGLMRNMTYDVIEGEVLPGESLLLYSDGLVEAHNSQGDMFGFKRLRNLLGTLPPGPDMIWALKHELEVFTGPSWEQEDDVTYFVIEHTIRT